MIIHIFWICLEGIIGFVFLLIFNAVQILQAETAYLSTNAIQLVALNK